MSRRILESVPAPITRGTLPANDLGVDAAAEWDGDPSAIDTAHDQPAETTTRALLLETRRVATATAAMAKAISRFTVMAGAFLLAILAALLVIAAVLYVRVAGG